MCFTVLCELSACLHLVRSQVVTGAECLGCGLSKVGALGMVALQHGRDRVPPSPGAKQAHGSCPASR